MDEVVKLGGELDTCGTSADDSEVEKLATTLFGGCGEGGRLEACQEAGSDFASIADVFEEEAAYVISCVRLRIRREVYECSLTPGVPKV